MERRPFFSSSFTSPQSLVIDLIPCLLAALTETGPFGPRTLRAQRVDAHTSRGIVGAKGGEGIRVERREERRGKGDRVDAEEQSHRFKLKPGNTREGETFAGLSGLITPGTDSI